MPEPTRTTPTYDNGDSPVLALKPADAARAIGISARLLWTWTNRGDIPCVRIGRRVVYPVRLLNQWLAERAANGKGGAT